MTNKDAFVKAVTDRAQQLMVEQYEDTGSIDIMRAINQATEEVTEAAVRWLKTMAEKAEEN